MRKRHLIWIVPLVLVAGALVALPTVVPALVDSLINRVDRAERGPVSDAARAFHETLNIADLHADSLLWRRDLTQRWDRGHVDVPRMIEGNMALQVFTTVTKFPGSSEHAQTGEGGFDAITLLAVAQLWPRRTWGDLTERALFQAQKLHDFSDASDRLLIVKNTADLEVLMARRNGGEAVVGGLLGTEGSHALSGNLDTINQLYDAGFRMMSLQHFFDNRLGGSLHGDSGSGLTDFGRQAVGRMEELGIMIDVSHSSEAVVRDTLEIVQRPVVISHTGTYGHCRSSRNASDKLMVEVAERGGLIGIGFWSQAICDASPKGIAAAIKAAIDLVGEDHVALGSDFDGAVGTPVDVSELNRITEALLDAGMEQETIRKVMGQNQIDFFAANLPAT
ncbi:MAG: membrane dipeptidase [Alphaproteobacteria bacterium]|nr:membrane dipeptidase [Alphaproteobacteria bacterium]